MNKLQGFYELKRHGLPSIAWRSFTGRESLDPNLLWTVRVAVSGHNDFNLPRAIGVSAAEAMDKGRVFLAEFTPDDLILYYPYFVAEKSGIIEMLADQTVIEAVADDLWNLTHLGKKDLTVIIDEITGHESKFGQTDFLSINELGELKRWSQKMRRLYRDIIFSGDILLLEWSFAVDTNIDHERLGEKHLVFTELKSMIKHK